MRLRTCRVRCANAFFECSDTFCSSVYEVSRNGVKAPISILQTAIEISPSVAVLRHEVSSFVEGYSSFSKRDPQSEVYTSYLYIQLMRT